MNKQDIEDTFEIMISKVDDMRQSYADCVTSFLNKDNSRVGNVIISMAEDIQGLRDELVCFKAELLEVVKK